MTAFGFSDIRVTRRTQETCFGLTLRRRSGTGEPVAISNRVLSHFLDHLGRSAGLEFEAADTAWPGSWSLDHVLCEDMGQLVGRGVKAILQELSGERGTPGRGFASCCMDDGVVEVRASFEERPAVSWVIPKRTDIDGLVDTWYTDRGSGQQAAYGTNLRQFVDGFAYGSGCTLAITVLRCGNLHHLYEVLFRALGEVVRQAMGIPTSECLPGDSSGIAGAVEYTLEKDTGASSVQV